ncbi:hypothetical protein GOV07_03715 [Candidatus Woesearchaeota archaeon]|nr:hypothetical protein [Candidatus Woesearchaeota archaeon]
MKVFLSIIAILCLLPLANAYVYHDYYGPYGGDEWIRWQDTWEADWLLNNKSHATPPFAPQTSFGGCFISTGHGLLDDLDCDGVPDVTDNCLGLPNPDQFDQNQNTIGDSCDLIVDRIVLDPPEVMEGRAFTATATLSNWRAFPIKSMLLTIQIPALGLDQQVFVDQIASGEQNHYGFYFRLPACVEAGTYDVVLLVEFPSGPGKQEIFYIPTTIQTTSSGLCEADNPLEGKSIISIIDIQDVDRVEGGIYPFIIVNDEPFSQAYILTVEGLDDWGSHEVRPRSLIVVPAGESREGELIVYANEDAKGEHGFLLTLRSKADAQQVLLTATVEDDVPGKSARAYTQFGIFILIAIILVVGLGIALHKAPKRRK